jgi:hypothetical protein
MPPLDFRENLIVDQNNPLLIQKAWRDHDRAGWAYLAAPYGEDALTWNVFRSLDKPTDVSERQQNRGIIQTFFGLQAPIQELLFWGCNPDGKGESQQRLSIALRTLDGRRNGTMTEPDLVVITESEVCFVECKLLFTRNPWSARARQARSPDTAADEDEASRETAGFIEQAAIVLVALLGAVGTEIVVAPSQTDHGLARSLMQAIRRDFAGFSRHGALSFDSSVNYGEKPSPEIAPPDAGGYAKLACSNSLLQYTQEGSNLQPSVP